MLITPVKIKSACTKYNTNLSIVATHVPPPQLCHVRESLFYMVSKYVRLATSTLFVYTTVLTQKSYTCS